MATTNTGFWVRVQDGQVTQVWDSQPPAGEDGWKPAVEIIPDATPNREYISHHTIDADKTPAEIVWHVAEMTVEDRKNALISQAKGEFQQVVNHQLQVQFNDELVEEYDSAAVTEAKAVMDARIAQVQAATTHEEVDALL